MVRTTASAISAMIVALSFQSVTPVPVPGPEPMMSLAKAGAMAVGRGASRNAGQMAVKLGKDMGNTAVSAKVAGTFGPNAAFAASNVMPGTKAGAALGAATFAGSKLKRQNSKSSNNSKKSKKSKGRR